MLPDSTWDSSNNCFDCLSEHVLYMLIHLSPSLVELLGKNYLSCGLLGGDVSLREGLLTFENPKLFLGSSLPDVCESHMQVLSYCFNTMPS